MAETLLANIAAATQPIIKGGSSGGRRKRPVRDSIMQQVIPEKKKAKPRGLAPQIMQALTIGRKREEL